jgi:hypothetical protein
MNILEYIIRAKDETGRGLSSAQATISGMGKNLASGFLSAVGKVAVGFGVITGAAALIQKAFAEAFEFQSVQAQLKTLLGSTEAAAKRMRELSSWKNEEGKGQFGMADVGKASMNLERLTEGALSGKAALNMLGDVAAATGNTMDAVSFAVGRAFGLLAQGMPIDRAMMQLQQLGVLGPDAIKQLKDLERQGASTAEMWNVIEAALARYKGGIADLANSGAGGMTQLKNEANEILETFGLWMTKGLMPVINAIKEAAGLLGRLAGGEGLAAAVDKALIPRDPLLRTKADVDAEEVSKAKKASYLEEAQQKQNRAVGKIEELRNLQTKAKQGHEMFGLMDKELQDLQAPGGFDRFASKHPELRATAGEMADAGKGKAYQAALARIGVENRAGHAPSLALDAGQARERQAMDAMKARNEVGRGFDLKDAQGFSDKAMSRLANKVLEGKKLSAAEQAAIDPHALSMAQERREQRLKNVVEKGGQLNRTDSDFMKQRKEWKEAQADAQKKRDAQDAKVQESQRKLDEVNRLKQAALDKIAANTDDLPDLLTAK